MRQFLLLLLLLTLAAPALGGQAGELYASSATPKVELYTTSWCPYCKKAVNFFRSRGISFVEYDIEKDKQAARRKQLLDSRPGVPLAIINGNLVHGFSESLYLEALGK
ncbi:hypothetical protein DESUT3_35210 [Desulfuromonas versatilis]|uniref:Glutaredoxin domain-containing protein n=1 Tax=Desulfuromonas versatilis TaxID=2802975 RepID=A0ABM8HU40_9BACT|nr:glutaredoxin family protein [Desulfuromonas versatilis]BCR06452.1 hypothetical protein DESUT3_35210 [Desulfuromonas versatilis]